MRSDFTEIKKFVNAWSMRIDPAYLHGSFTGLVCIGEQLDNTDNWLPVILSERHYNDEEYQLLSDESGELFTNIEQQFMQDGFGFKVQLPDDDEPLHTRVSTLNEWCLGFLDVLVNEGEISLQEPPENYELIVEYVLDVAGAIVDDNESLEEQEYHFVIIKENLRMVVQLFYEMQHPLPGPQNLNLPPA